MTGEVFQDQSFMVIKIKWKISPETSKILSSSRTRVRVKLGLFNAKIPNENRRYIHRLIYQLNEQDLLCHAIVVFFSLHNMLSRLHVMATCPYNLYSSYCPGLLTTGKRERERDRIYVIGALHQIILICIWVQFCG